MTAYPETDIDVKISLCRRWTLCQAMVQQFWKRWSREFVQQLQASNKWNAASPNLAVGDVVLASAFQTNWGLARVTAVFPGKDGLVRAAEVLVKKVIIPDSSVKRPILPSQLKVKTSTLRRPITKLALLIPACKTSMKSQKGDLHGREDVQATVPEQQQSSQTATDLT